MFEAVGGYAKGTIDDDELRAIERAACPGTGACGGLYTANTMSSVGEALGMMLPGSASPPPWIPPRGVRRASPARASLSSWRRTARSRATS